MKKRPKVSPLMKLALEREEKARQRSLDRVTAGLSPDEPRSNLSADDIAELKACSTTLNQAFGFAKRKPSTKRIK